MSVLKQTFYKERRSGGNPTPDSETTHSLAYGTVTRELYVLRERSTAAGGAPASAERIELDDFVAAPSKERDSLFGLMVRHVPGAAA